MKLPSRTSAIFASLFLASGFSLLVYVFAGISLLWAFIFSAVVVLSVGIVVWHKVSPEKKEYLKKRILIGMFAGLLATLSYDLARFILIEITGIAFWPFDIFEVFGRALFGADAHGTWIKIAGLTFHLINGISFGIAYTLFAGRAGILGGIVWAFFLEFMMVVVYPGWLGITAIGEFLQVSVFGHVIYGMVLGWLSRRFIIKHEPANQILVD